MLAVIAFSCKKDKGSTASAGFEEGKKIETAVIGHKYRIESITSENGADVSGLFASCIMDDIYFFKDRGTIEIGQGANKCGKEGLDKKNGSWAIAYDENEVSAIQVPFFEKGADYYQTKEFLKPLFSVNLDSGTIILQFKVGTSTYSIKLVQTL